MDRAERVRRLKDMLRLITDGGDLETLVREPSSGLEGGLESMPGRVSDAGLESAHRGVQKVAHEEELSEQEIHALEAIVLPRERPVIFIQNDSYGTLPAPWTHYAGRAIRGKIEAAIPSVGRIELPESPWIPYGGTGFVVGDGLLMTNRHVAELFASGLGIRNLAFRAGQTAAIDFKREADSPASINIRIRQIVMIHPFWDMAILRVDGLPAGHAKLTLSVVAPEELDGRDVAVIGYPARDDRNDLALQDEIFERTYNVKRLHPGRIRPRATISSFGNRVAAMTHDSSTLGGNSGSAVLDVQTGEIVGLHFAGIYLKANYCVPTYELARDRRVVDAGVHFRGAAPSTDEWLAAWRLADPESTSLPAGSPWGGSDAPNPPAAPAPPAGAVTPPLIVSPVQTASPVQSVSPTGAVTWTVPLTVSVTLGAPVPASPQASLSTTGPTTEMEVLEAMRVPVIHPGLETRTGYQPDFLDPESVVPLPELTAAGKRAVAKLDDGDSELRYHKFSIVVHKGRRLALYTAANVDWRKTSRLVDGRKPTRKQLNGFVSDASEKWVTDPRLPDNYQLPDVFFTKDGGAFDKGHLVRRDDVCWGESFDDIQMANGDTFHTTNCSPQVGIFNQARHADDNWGRLEDLVQDETEAERAIVFAGPVFAEDDPAFAGRDKRGPVSIRIPRKFWKIVVVTGEQGLEAYGFVLEQDLSNVPTELEFAVPALWKPFHKPISEIEKLLGGLAKLTQLKSIDQHRTPRGRRLSAAVEAAS